MRIFLLFSYLSIAFNALSQNSPLFRDLPVGKYPVGFKIITINDSSRVTKPLYNYFGERETGDRYQRISIHLWYPSKASTGNGTITYNEYCYNHLFDKTSGIIDNETKSGMVNSMRNTLEGFFGKISDDSWQQLSNTKMLAQKDAVAMAEKFPLLVGTLRPLS